jgi:hypothetical protein
MFCGYLYLNFLRNCSFQGASERGWRGVHDAGDGGRQRDRAPRDPRPAVEPRVRDWRAPAGPRRQRHRHQSRAGRSGRSGGGQDLRGHVRLHPPGRAFLRRRSKVGAHWPGLDGDFVSMLGGLPRHVPVECVCYVPSG